MNNDVDNKGGRRLRVAENLMHLAAEFFRIESNHQSLMTITRADVAPNFSESTIYFTVLPESQEEHALNFAKRKRRDFKHYVKKRVSMKRIPFFDFAIDAGEKHRQHIDEISRGIKE
jgi:ribosome-binding factor A